MSVAIRLRMAGTKNKPFFHVVATHKRNARNGKFLEKLGHYDPVVNPPVFSINKERFDYWLSVGAQASPTVSQLVAKTKAEDGESRTDATT
ncbi:MAG: 30S ribosomal protein S16 [Deltaproteobacteria bacterium]|nr:30S ribosomal protein S16 [Deltaproteobacteria bacterium]